MKKSILFLFSMILAAGLYAQEAAPAAPELETEPAAPEFESEDTSSDWVITAGVSYRNFKNPKLKSVKSASFEDYVLNGDDGMFYDAGTPANPNQQGLSSAWDAKYPDTPSGGYGRLTFGSFESFNLSKHGSYGVKDQTAPILGFEKGIWEKDQLDLKVVGNFQFFSMDSGFKNSGIGTGNSVYDYWVAKNPSGTLNYSKTFKYDSSTGTNGKVPFATSTDIDMNLYVFDLGVNFGYNFDCGLRGFVAAGPTLTLADMNSASRCTVTTGNNTARVSDSDDDTEFNWGVYASAGAGYWFTESFGLSGEVRYDYGCGDVGTRYFSQDMDTVGGILKLQYCF